MALVELRFRKGRVQTESMRALCTGIFAVRVYEAFFSGSKGHFNIVSFDPVQPFAFIYRHYMHFFMLKVLKF